MLVTRLWQTRLRIPRYVGLAVLIAALVQDGTILEARQRTIRCESSRNRQNFCRVETEGRAVLIRERSRNRCTQWRTWGFERRGVWVRDGCRGDFRVGSSGGGGIGAGTGALIGAGVGAAMMAAILAGRNSGSGDNQAPQRTPPRWVVGSFRGFDPRENIELDITVDAQGNVTGTADEKPIGGRTTEGGILIGTADFAIAEQPWGFSARHRDSAGTTLYFRRIDGQ